jgi:CMP-N-acetylneuraminic acid synthetase
MDPDVATAAGTLAVIPARGGSRGIPRKNLKRLGGLPLVSRAILQGLSARSVDRVVVSTDDEEIAAEAERSGAEVIWRPSELAGDRTPTLPVLTHALESLKTREPPTRVVTLQPTSPLRTARQIDEAVALLTEGCDAVMSVCVAEHSPYKMFRIEGETLEPLLGKGYEGVPRQALPGAYRENGAIYVTWSRVLTERGSLRGDRIRPYVMDAESSLDIDTLLDLELAELVHLRRNGKGAWT